MMKKNKRLLVPFLALNALLPAYASGAGASETVKYDNLYNKMAKNLEQGKSNQKNYQIIERILKQRNKELSDLYIQGDYIVKPEYLEWQIFASGFYGEKDRGKSSEFTLEYDSEGNLISNYDKGSSESRIKDLRTQKYIQIGATIPIKTVADFVINPNINLSIQDIDPINIAAPATKIEKAQSISLPNITGPVMTAPSLSPGTAPNVNITKPVVNFSFDAGHNAGAPPGPLAGTTNESVAPKSNGILTTADFSKTVLESTNAVWRFYSVSTGAGQSKIIASDVVLTARNEKDGNGYFTFENSPGATMISILGTVTILPNSQTNYIVGDTVDGDARATTYNGGRMNVYAAQTHKTLNAATDAPSGGGAMMYIPTNHTEPNQIIPGVNSNKYLVNGEGGTIHIQGFGNYGILNVDMDHTVRGYGSGAGHINDRFGDAANPGKFIPKANGEVDINVILNQGNVIVEKTPGSGGFNSQYGNVALSAFAQEKPLPTSAVFNNYLGMIFDNTTFMYNDGTIKSVSGNNMLMQHKGSGQMINNGVLDIESGQTIGMIRENIGHRGYTVTTSNTTTSHTIWDAANSRARAVNDGIINISASAKDVLGIKGIGYDGNGIDDNVNSRHLIYNAESKIIVENGDGIVNGIDIDQNGNTTGSHNLDIDRSNVNSYGANMGGLVTVKETLDEAKTVSFTLNSKVYSTKDGVILVGGKNAAGLYAETKNAFTTSGFSGNGIFNPNSAALPDASHIDYAQARNNIDGKIFVYASGNSAADYSIGMAGQYASLENAGDIFLGLLPQAGMITGSGSGVKTEGGVSSAQEQYIGIYGNGSSVYNKGYISDKESNGTRANYSKNGIGIFVEKKAIANGSTGYIVNTGDITLGTGGKGVVGTGRTAADMITLISSGNIEVKGSAADMAVGIYGSYADSDKTDTATSKTGISGNIGILGETAIGIYFEHGKTNIHDLNITGTNTLTSDEVDRSFGIAVDSSDLKIGNKVNIELKGDDNIGIFGKSSTYTDAVTSLNRSDYTNIVLGSGGIGIYLEDIKNNSLLKVNNIVIGNSTATQNSGGIALKSTTNKAEINAGNITIGNTETVGEGFGIFVEGASAQDSKITSGNITVNQKSGIGIFGKNVTEIAAGNIKAGKTGIYQESSSTASGKLTAGNVALTGSENEMIGVYANGSSGAVDTEINGIDMQNAQNESTGIYIGRGSFKNTGNINIKALNSSFGIYIKGIAGHNTVDFGTGTTAINLGNDSIGLYLKDSQVSNMISDIIIGNTTGAPGTQAGVGMFLEDTIVTSAVNTNITSGNRTVASYFGANTGNITYNGNVQVGENSLGVYKNGGTLTRDPGKTTIFSGSSNTESIGYYLENSTLDYSSNAINANTLSMNNGIAFLLKGAASQVTVNGVPITNSDLDKLGLDPKVERFVYSDKQEIITENVTLDPSVRHFGYHAVSGRIELNADIYTNSGIQTTYGILAQGRYGSGTEEVFVGAGRTIDMTNSLGSIGIEVLEGARAKNEGIIKAGRSSSTSSGIGILVESTVSPSLVIAEAENASTGVIEILESGIGIYLDSAERGGIITNNGIIRSSENNTLGIYSKLSALGVVNPVPVSTITNNRDILLKNDSFGMFAENSNINNAGNITVGDSVSGNSVAVYGSKKSVINNSGGTITTGENGLGFYLDNSQLNITGGVFNTEKGILIYAANESNVNYAASNTVLGDKIGFYIDNSTADFNSKEFTVLDNGVGLYVTNTQAGPIQQSALKSLGKLILGNNSTGIYLKNADLAPVTVGMTNYTLGGAIEINGVNSAAIVGINSNIENTSNISTSVGSNKGIVLKTENAGTYNLKNSSNITLGGDKSIGMYGTTINSAGVPTGSINIDNSGTISVGNAAAITDASVGIYGSAGVNITNNGIINGGINSVGIYSNGGALAHNSGINLSHGSVGIYASGGTATVNSGSSITVGDTGAVALYANNGAVLVNHSSNINTGTGSVIGYAKDSGTMIDNRGSLSIQEEGVGFYTNSGHIVNSGVLSSAGKGIIYLYGNSGIIENNGQINGSSHGYGVGIYGNNSDIKNTSSITLGDSHIPYPNDLSNTDNRFAVGIYGEGSKIDNSSNITVGENGIGIYSYAQSGNIINSGQIISTKDKSIGIFSEVGKNGHVINSGLIDLAGKSVIGVAINKGATLDNHGIIKVSGDESIAVLAESSSVVNNYNTIDVSGTNSVAVVLKDKSSFINHSGATLILGAGSLGILKDSTSSVTGASSSSLSGTSVVLPSLASVPIYEPPQIINSGIIKVEGNFEVPYDGVVKVKVDPDSVRELTHSEKISSGYELQDLENVILISNAVKYEADSFNIKDVTVTSDFTEGTNALTYKLENVFMPRTSKAGVTSGIASVYSESYTWDAIPVTNADGNVDIWMKKIAYKDLMEGEWYEDFGSAMDEKYAGSTGDAGNIFDKIDRIKNGSDFKTIMESLGGNVYANINEREDDMARAFENSLSLLQNSHNNTKENVKVNVIAGKGKTTEDTAGVTGYNYEMAGVLALREVERTYRHTFGYSLGYLHTDFEFKDGMKSEELVDTLQIGGHNKYKVNSWILKNDITGRVSFHNVDRNVNWPSPYGRAEINGSYETYSITSNNILGKELNIGKNSSITPYGGLRAMYVTRPSFEEKGLERLEVEGNDAWSVKPKLGVELKTSIPLGKTSSWKLKGALDLGYEYELANLNEREKARLVAIEDGYHKLAKPDEEKGAFRGGASLGVEVEDRYGIFLTGEYKLGNNNQDDYRAGITLKAVF
jgi:hypothetical protein